MARRETRSGWRARTEHPVPAGIDGEAAKLEPPLHFHIRPGVLRERRCPDSGAPS